MNFLPQYVLGIDVSKWQSTMSWDITKAAGAQYAFIRAGSINSSTGVCYTDDQFERNAALAPEYLPCGFYWYFRPNLSVVLQADYFINLIGSKKWTLRPVIDIEEDGGLLAATVRDRLKQMANLIHAALGIWPLIYTRTSFFDPNVATDPMWPTLDLFIARYDETLSHPWGDGLYDPRDWATWVFWQFSADGNFQGSTFGASSKHIDLDYFNGTLEQLMAYLGIEPPVEIPVMQTLLLTKHLSISGSGIVSFTVPENEVWTINTTTVKIAGAANTLRVFVTSPSNISAVIGEICSVSASASYPIESNLYLDPGYKIQAKALDCSASSILTFSVVGAKMT